MNTIGTVEFGMKDAKGRALGVVWAVWAVTDMVCVTGRMVVRKSGYAVRVEPVRDGQRMGRVCKAAVMGSLDAAFTEVANRAHEELVAVGGAS